MGDFKSLRDHVYNYISSKIQTGELQPNQKLNEAQICEDLAISRTPAREALILLAADDLLDYAPRKGFFVKEMSAKEKLDTYTVLAQLDALAATLALPYLDESDILKMNEVIDKIDIAIKYKNYASYSELQNEFHSIYVQKCNNRTVIKLIHSIENSFLPLTYVDKEQHVLFPILKELNDEHRHIISLLEKKAKDELEAFIKNVHWQTKYPDYI